MEISKLKQYTKNLSAFSAEEVDVLELMTDQELNKYQSEIENGTGNVSDWDSIRALYTMKNKIHDLKIVLNEAHLVMLHHLTKCPLDDNFSFNEHMDDFRETIQKIYKYISGNEVNQ